MTLVEALIGTWLVAYVIGGGLVAVHLMGLKYEQLLESKAGASDSARRNVGQFRNDIYGAKGLQLGSWNGSTFTTVTNGSYQQGTALIIYPVILTSNQNVDVSQFILYYFDSSDIANNNGCLRYTNSINGSSKITISNLIAPLIFISEDYLGRTQTVRNYKGVIHTTFQYSQFQFPLTKVGTNYLFNSYRIDVRATPHLPDGP